MENMIPKKPASASTPSPIHFDLLTPLQAAIANEFMESNFNDHMAKEIVESGKSMLRVQKLQHIAHMTAHELGIIPNEANVELIMSMINFGYLLRQVVEKNPAPRDESIGQA